MSRPGFIVGHKTKGNMTYEQAKVGAQQAANKSRMNIALVLAPIECAEEQGDYGFCPELAKNTLYRFGETQEIIQPNKGET
jgi:hypothetical protein